ncbi:MAG: hypothetical protein AMJ79_06185 [Phycisphaerae bacterium SM23_30]|nr:MAG: hypothetical protein AMJ79_06185 [Phycisphaerae bacterium SM23_30]
MNINDKELRNLLAQLYPGEDQLRAAVEDIQQGDDLMRRLDRIRVDPAILDRAEARVRREPARSERRQANFNRSYDKELYDLPVQLALGEDQARAALEEIKQGDDLMRRLDQIQVDPEVLDRTEARVRQAPERSEYKRRDFGWPSRAAVLAASLIIALGLIIYLMPQKTGMPPSDYDTGVYWQQVLIQENEVDQEVSDMVLSEVLKCWSEVDWKVDDILGSDSELEPDSIDVSQTLWAGPRLCQ